MPWDEKRGWVRAYRIEYRSPSRRDFSKTIMVASVGEANDRLNEYVTRLGYIYSGDTLAISCIASGEAVRWTAYGGAWGTPKSTFRQPHPVDPVT